MIEGTATTWVWEWLTEEIAGEEGDKALLLNREIERIEASNEVGPLAHFIEWRVTEEITRGLGPGIQLTLITAALEAVSFREIAEAYKYAADEREAMERDLI